MSVRHDQFPDPEDERRFQRALTLLGEMDAFLAEYSTAASCEAIGISADRRARIEAARDTLRRTIGDRIEKGRALMEATDRVKHAQSDFNARLASAGLLPN